jgi:hypothetical protein
MSKAGRTALAAATAAMLTSGIGMALAARPGGVPVPPTPGVGHQVFALPMQDAVTGVSDPNVTITVNVVRAGVVVGSATVLTDATGAYNVNHPGGVCFTGSTPLISPQDTIQVVNPGGVGESTVVQNVTATAPIVAGGVVQVHGAAADALGNQIPLANLDVRIVNGGIFDANGRRDIRAGGPVAANGTLTYDTPTGTAFTATWSTLDAHDQGLVASSSQRADWLGVNPALGNEGTTYDVGFFPAPMPQCLASAPLSNFSVTGLDRTLINVANAGTPLVVSGTAASAGAPTVTLDDANAATPAIVVSPTIIGSAFAATWTATFTPAQLATLTDGALTVTGAYTPPGALTPLPGGTLALTKDTTAPLAPTATPAPGIFLGAQTVKVANADPTAVIHYTTDGVTVPDAASPVMPAAGIPVPSGTVTIRAVAIDPATNAGPVSSFTYTIAQAAITAADRASVSIANASTALTLSGTSVNAPALTVSLDDASVATPAVTAPAVISGPLSAQTWTATFTPAQVGSLADGTLKASALLGTLVGGTFTLPKDTAAPPSPTASLASNTYQGVQSTTLNDGDASATIFYTTDGSVPSALNGVKYVKGTAIAIPGGVTHLSAVAVDGVGNTGPLSAFTYNIIFGTTSSATSMNLGNAVVGQSSAPKFVTLTNASPDPVTFTSATTTGPNASEFVVGGGTCSPATPLAPAASCTVGVTLSPTATAALKSATLTILDSSATGNHTVALTGTAAAATRTVSVSPTTVAFNKVVNGTTANQVLTVTSTGNTATPVTVTLGGANANQYSVTSNCPAPGATCQVTLVFHPTVRANANATVTVAGGTNSATITVKGSVK